MQAGLRPPKFAGILDVLSCGLRGRDWADERGDVDLRMLDKWFAKLLRCSDEIGAARQHHSTAPLEPRIRIVHTRRSVAVGQRQRRDEQAETGADDYGIATGEVLPRCTARAIR